MAGTRITSPLSVRLSKRTDPMGCDKRPRVPRLMAAAATAPVTFSSSLDDSSNYCSSCGSHYCTHYCSDYCSNIAKHGCCSVDVFLFTQLPNLSNVSRRSAPCSAGMINELPVIPPPSDSVQ